MKKTILLLLVFILVFTLFSCESKVEEKEVLMNDIYLNMIGVANFQEMEYFDSGDYDAETIFENISDMEYNKILEFFITDAKVKKGNADEIILVHVKKDSYVNDVFDDLQNHWTQRITNYQNYDPSQVSKLEDGELFKYGNYVVLIVCDNALDVKEAFLKTF